MSNLTRRIYQKVWRVCGILAFVTIFEIAAALFHFYSIPESPQVVVEPAVHHTQCCQGILYHE